MDDQPWLKKKKWAKNHILSSAKTGMGVLIVFTIVWWAINILLWLNYDEIRSKIEQEPIVLMVLMLPITGVWMLFLTYKAISQWMKIGPTPLVLDPFPGSIGGQVGGYIDTNISYDPNVTTKVSLQSIYSYMSRSGKNRSRSERVTWQSDGICHNDHSAKGMQFRFRFDVPAELQETDITASSSDYYLWRLHIEANISKTKLDRIYEVPVFNTAQNSIGISNGTEDYKATIDASVDGIESIAKLRTVADGIEAWFPAFQRPGNGIMMLMFGLIFVGVAVGLGMSDSGAPVIFPIVFSIVGGIIALAGINYLAKALLISVTSTGIKTRRFLFGLPITTKTLLASDFKKFELEQAGSMQSGGKTTVYYRLYAHGINGEKLPVGERLTSRSEVEALKESFERHISAAS